MDFFDVVRLILRQWLVCVIGILVVVAGAAGVMFMVPTNYQASGQLVLLLPPSAAGPEKKVNPYLNLDANMTLTASLVASSVTIPGVQKEMEAAGFTSSYSVALTPGSGPVLVISSEDTDPQMAVKTRDEVMKRIQAELTALQTEAQAPEAQVIYTQPVASPARADPLPGSKVRALAVVGGLGLIITLLFAVALDRRRGARSKASTGAPQTPLPAAASSAVSAARQTESGPTVNAPAVAAQQPPLAQATSLARQTSPTPPDDVVGAPTTGVPSGSDEDRRQGPSSVDLKRSDSRSAGGSARDQLGGYQLNESFLAQIDENDLRSWARR